ncbi:MAG: choice-of-anchor B family protein [Bacteroidota bacterium]
MLKKILVQLCILFTFMQLHAQDSLNMTRLSHWDDDALPIAAPGNLNLQYSGCWGIAVNGHEYAFLGGALHVLIFDITNPYNPKLVGKFAGTTNTVWREFKSYKNRVYEVTDGTAEGMMIFDMSQAPDTIIRSYWSNELFNSSHSITLDTVSGHIYLNGTNVVSNGSLILDVSQNPDKPTIVAEVPLEGGYIHDSYVRNDTLYASSGYNGYYIYNMKNPQAPVTLASCSTGGYNHLSWLNKEGTYAYYTEEIPKGRPIQIVDLHHLTTGGGIEPVVSFLDNLTLNSGSLAIPHNIYIKNNLLFDSQYEDGLLVYDISVPLAPVLVAHYDTHPENTIYNGYFGCWGNYPWLPSGTIIAGDMQNGLQILKITTPTSVKQPTVENAVTVSPNPAHETLNIKTTLDATAWTYRILNVNGALVKSGTVEQRNEANVALAGIAAGMYVVEIRDAKGRYSVAKVAVR